MRISLAGLGAAAVRGHLPALASAKARRLATLVAVADPDAERRAAVGPLGLPVFDSAEAMLDAVPSDLLVVAAESPVHARLALLGMRYRRHVLCEKPLALTRTDHERVATASGRRPALGLLPVHQYRYSPAWAAFARGARVANRLRMPFKLVARVARDGLDRHAVSTWRANPLASGGMLADHGVHFLALAWTIHERLELIDVWRRWDGAGRERAFARIRLGHGTLELELSAGASTRSTELELRAAALRYRWRDRACEVAAGTRVVRRRDVAALSDRGHVDALYSPLYREMLVNLENAEWRTRRTAEALTVSAALVEALELAPA